MIDKKTQKRSTYFTETRWYGYLYMADYYIHEAEEKQTTLHFHLCILFPKKKTEEHYFINWSGFFGSYLQSFGVARLCLSIFSLKGKKSRKIGWVVLLQASSLVSSRGTVSASTAAPLTSVSQVHQPSGYKCCTFFCCCWWVPSFFSIVNAEVGIINLNIDG